MLLLRCAWNGHIHCGWLDSDCLSESNLPPRGPASESGGASVASIALARARNHARRLSLRCWQGSPRRAVLVVLLTTSCHARRLATGATGGAQRSASRCASACDRPGQVRCRVPEGAAAWAGPAALLGRGPRGGRHWLPAPSALVARRGRQDAQGRRACVDARDGASPRRRRAERGQLHSHVAPSGAADSRYRANDRSISSSSSSSSRRSHRSAAAP